MQKLPNDDLVAALAEQLLAARSTGELVQPGGTIKAHVTADLALTVQATVARALGPVGGFKVSNRPDAPRIMAPILAGDMLTSPALLPVPRDEGIGIELEVGFRVDAPLPPRDAPDRRTRVADCLSAVAVIEVVRTRLWPGAGRWLKLADNQSNGGLVTGTPVRDWQRLDLSRPVARLDLGRGPVLDGPAQVPGGDAFANFLVLEEMVGSHCGGLHAGQVVITGSLNGLPVVRGTLAIRGEIAGLGAVSLDLQKI